MKGHEAGLIIIDDCEFLTGFALGGTLAGSPYNLAGRKSPDAPFRPLRDKILCRKLPDLRKTESGLWLSLVTEPEPGDMIEGLVLAIGCDVWDVKVGEVVGFSKYYGYLHTQTEGKEVASTELKTAEDYRVLTMEDVFYARPATKEDLECPDIPPMPPL